ncbi:hypothetical protein KC219_26970, partial [Mycobacterium tuberculosis]|nr:hypothetical protein [Mycobacterium tuberculosis]
ALSKAGARDLLAEAAADTDTASSDTDSPGDAAAPPQAGADVREDIVDSREGVVDDLPVSIRTMMAEAPEHGALRRRITVG